MAFNQISLRQRRKVVREFAKPHVIVRVDDDANARVQFFVFVDNDLGARSLAKYTLDLEFGLLFDGEVWPAAP